MPVEHILTTHHHYDHDGGNNAVKRAYPNVRITSGKDDKVKGSNEQVSDGQIINLCGNKIPMKCIHTPCHTKGSTCYYVEATDQPTQHSVEYQGIYKIIKNINRCIFTGDTVFLGGCGHFMEGTPDQMQRNMDMMRSLPDDTKMFGGHEYTQANFQWCYSVEKEFNPKV